MGNNNFVHVSISLCDKGNFASRNIVKLIFEEELNGNCETCNTNCNAVLHKLISDSYFEAKLFETAFFTSPKENVKNLILFGLGKKSEFSEKSAANVGGELYKIISRFKKEPNFQLIGNIEDKLLLNIAHGLELKSWKFDKYITQKENNNKECYLTVANQDQSNEILKSLKNISSGVNLAKELISEPANIIYPETFVERAKELEQYGVKLTILDKEKILQNKMLSLMAVAQGSIKDPRVLILEWHGNSQKNNNEVGFVGKGVTFDSGGINLKPSDGLKTMKTDMSGAATVVGLMKILATRKAKVNAIGICGLVENMPSGNAQKVGDIVTSMSGITIEVQNTDAEGRMVLGDCITYMQEKFSPETIIDLATLTGAAIVALGYEYAGLFSNDNDLSKNLIKAGEKTDELLWELPLCKRFDDAIKSDVADIMNISKPGTGAGSSTAAHFLKRFVKNGTKWAHIDIAGPAYISFDKKLSQKGATGFGVRLLNKFVEDNFE